MSRWTRDGLSAAGALGALTLALAFAAPQPAVAAEEPTAESGDAQAQALSLFEASEKLYREGRFEEAAALLEQAYELHPEPTLLYNLARAREGQGELGAAADAYESYLEGSPDAPDRGAIEQRIRSLRTRKGERERLEAEKQEARDQLAQMERERAEQPPDEGNALEGPFPWILFGVGVAGVGVGLGIGAAAQSKHDEAVEEPIQLEAVDKQDSAESLATVANIVLVAGGAVAAAGAILGIVGLASSSSGDEAPPAAAWQLRVGPGFVGLDGRF
ncbi:MAG: tetratricopeptide repeat protein [Deltaproteobacteria bacterium]|jgi:tetratricopeptide (TPR) repeat protein|nr:tetratricopeptide repeat protein [Deltaproteobacteria bacterium]MBW2532439.1 tetratricopeptide repeat protein [Deltaproteobacteria bacterium]